MFYHKLRYHVSVVGSELELITRTRVPYSNYSYTKLSVVKLEHSGGAFVHVVTPESFVSEYGTLGLVLNSLSRIFFLYSKQVKRFNGKMCKNRIITGSYTY